MPQTLDEAVGFKPDAPSDDFGFKPLSDDEFGFQPDLKTVLKRTPLDTRIPSDLSPSGSFGGLPDKALRPQMDVSRGINFGPGVNVGPPTLGTMLGENIPGPDNLARPQYDHDALDRVVDQFKQSRLGQTLFGQGQPEDSPASDIQRHGAASLLGIPGRIGNTMGTGARALLGDAGSALRGENGGNVKAFLNRDGLPIIQASADAKAEAKEQGQTGWESLVSDISLGLADLAPKVAMLEGSPGGAISKTGAAASIFGTDEKGNIDPKNAAFAAAFPYAMKLTSVVTDKAIQGAVDRGLTWAGNPGAQKAIHIAANQASMDALMTAQASPELADLLESDPQEFKRQLAKILGSNLAFAIPEALKSHGGPPSGPDNIAPAGQPPAEPRPPVPEPPKPAEPPAEVTRDLIAELKASLEKAQIVKPKENVVESPRENVTATATAVEPRSETELEQPPAVVSENVEPQAQAGAEGQNAAEVLPASEKPPLDIGQFVEWDRGGKKERGWISGIYEAPGSPGVSQGGYKYAHITTENGGNTQEVLSVLRPAPEPVKPTRPPLPEPPPVEKAVEATPAASEPTGEQLRLETPEEFLKRHGKEIPPPKVAEPAPLEPEGDLGGQARAEEPQPDAPEEQPGFAGWLDRAIEATKPGTGWTGQTSMGLARIPGWLTQEAVHGTLKIVRKAYQATGKIADAIESGVAWLYEQNIKGFNMDEAHAWLTDAVKNAKEVVERLPEAAQEPKDVPTDTAEPSREVPPTGTRDWRTVKAEMESASEGLRQAIHDHMENGGADRKNAKNLAAAKYRTLRDELLTNRDYAADLLTRHQAAMDAGNKAESDSLRTSLEELPPKVMNSVHSQLQEQGKLRKSPAPIYGRSLDQLTDWLKREGVDSPKLTLKDRLQKIADKWSDKWQAGKDALDSTRMKIMAAWKTAVKNYKSPPTDSGFRNVIKDWNFAEQWTGLQTRRWIHELKRQVVNPIRRKAISVWMDANGDEGTLRYQASAVPERFKGIWDTALRLTDSEKALARQIKQDFAAKLEDAMNAGLIEKGREDYGVPQVWKTAPEVDPAIEAQGNKGSPGNPNAKLDPRSPFFSFQRSHPSYFDGIMHGGDPRSLDIADLVGVYNEAFHKSLAGRAMIHALKNELAADGQPIIKLSGAVRQVSDSEPGAYFVDSKARDGGETSADGRPYKAIDHFALRDWKVANKTPEGKTILVRGDMLVHPDHFEFLKNELMPSPLREGVVSSVIDPLMKSGAFMKASKMSFAGFHLATIGEHMASHLVWPFTNGFALDLRKPDQALLVRNGLEIGMAGQRMAFEEGLASHGGLFRQVPGLGDLSARITDWMFKEYIPTISMKVGLRVLERNRKRYAGKLSDSQIAEITARQMNAASGLTSYRVGGSENNFMARLGANKAWMDLNRMALLAPQFLAARAKVVGQALKPYGAEQRRMLILQAGVLYVGARILNQLLDDDPHWELKAAFGVVHNGQMYSIRTIVGDAWHALTDPASFASGRLAPWVKIVAEGITQRDMRTGARKEPPIQTEWKPSRYAQNLVVDIAKWMLPIGSEGFTPGAAGREQSKAGSILALAGVGTHKYTAQSQVFDWAKDFNRNSPDPATRTWQRHKDADAHGESAYRKLNALLDADKIDAARTEYEALLKDGHTEKALAQHYRHFAHQAFTGNRARETAFTETLNPRQLKIYQKAIAEREALSEKFNKMLPEPVNP